MPSVPHVVVIGAGLAGLSAAVELASAGAKVTIIDRNAHLGGKMNLLQERGFSFDMGPTILTLPQVLTGIIERAGRRPADYIKLINLDPQWRCFYTDGTVINLRQAPETFAGELDAQFPGTNVGRQYLDFITYSRRMMGLSGKVFYYKDVGSPMDMMRGTPPGDLKILADVLAMKMHKTVGGTVHSAITEPHVRQLVEHFLQYVGSSPFLAPAILSLIAAAQTDHGCWYSMAPDGQAGEKTGGTRCVARALSRLLGELNATVITGAGVTKITTSGRRATGVMLDDGRTIACDAVVSNCDVQRTLRDLVGTPEAIKKQKAIAKDYTPACSGVVLYLGLDRQYEHLAHHNFLFSGSSEDEFGDIYTRGVPARDPTLYLAVPSRTDPTQAPAGCEALYVLVHTPFKRDAQNWDGPGGLLASYKPVIMDRLRKTGMPDIDEHIVVDRFLHPGLIDQMYNAEGGAIYGLASHGKLIGGFKPRNRSGVIDNLYLAGGSTNPGPGVPMVLMSGVTAANAVREDLGTFKPGEAVEKGRIVTTLGKSLVGAV
ncbi:NAD(P)/FAD-dependent oxidoreductase [Synechococcus sp. Cruz CV-v-12]|uniref:phytoene desaturase family protein n=1 Tax=Synechococcus sp. Cruz CV-v-12 TaxID=2823728 RepID=UPI0020CC1996|nr:phytoene desaturase family protein [Synechococcus sp. Cruz CV-v-12]MCP9874826.1 phytoene desaturase [Synechococcus sp. Cruz CV-v-12]